MEPKKRNLKDLIQDKRFLWSIPVFIIVVGIFLWMVSSSPEQTTPAEPASAINTKVPSAKTDSLLANRLDLQSETAEQTAATTPMQGVPGTEPYVYGKRYNPSVRSVNRLDSGVYDRPANRSETGSSGFPNQVNTRRATSSSPGSMPLSEADGQLDDDAPITSPQQAKDQAAKRAQLAQALEKQAKLEKLLTEYKKDKALKQARENDKTKVLKVITDEEGRYTAPITSLTGRDRSSRNAFFGLYTEDARKAQQRLLDEEVGTIRAMVYGDQEINTTGSRIKIRLLEPLYVRGIIIPTNTLLYGMGQFSGQRVNLVIRSIQYQNRLFPVNIQVYDMDGMVGLYVPNMTNLDLAKQTASQVAQNGLGSSLGGGVYLNGSAQAVAASAALQAGQQVVQGIKQGIARKAQIQRAYLKNNYFVLLRTLDTTPSGGTAGTTQALPASAPLTEKQLQLQMLQNILKEQ